MIHFLEISVSIVFFANKVFILAGKKVGWLVGVIAATLALIYFWQIELYVFTVLEFGLIVLMGYGFVKKGKVNQRVELGLNVFLATIMLAMTVFTFANLMTVTEFIAAICMLLGTYLLTHQMIRFGWLIYGLAHVLAAVVGFSKQQTMFVDFQLASAIVAMVGAMKKDYSARLSPN